MRESLQQIGERLGVVKATQHSYLPIYDELFHKMRDHSLQVLEIGVGDGKSAKMWLEYFPKATVFGVDNLSYPYAVDFSGKYLDDRFLFLKIDATSEHMGNMFIPECMGIIIDDASHIPEEQHKAFKNLWPCLKLDGYYVIEDVISIEEANQWEKSTVYGKVHANFKESRTDDILVVIRK